MIEFRWEGDDIIVTGTNEYSRCQIDLIKANRRVEHLQELTALMGKQIDRLEEEVAVAHASLHEARAASRDPVLAEGKL